MTSSNVRSLLDEAKNQGSISPASMKSILAEDLGAQIQAALGTPVEDVLASEVVLVSQLIDDSGSIRMEGNAQTVRDGHNLVFESLGESKQSGDILAFTRYLNGTVLFPYSPLSQVVLMDTHNYNPNKGTPLYDETVSFLATILAKSQEFARNGVPVRTVSLILTDGNDQHSNRHTIATVRPIVTDLLKMETHIIAAMGIDDGKTDFRNVFQEMGIRDEWILTPKNDKREIRRCFQLFSRSAVKASQNAASFSQTALAGFTN